MYAPIELVTIVGKATYDRGLGYANRGAARIFFQEEDGRKGTVYGESDGTEPDPYSVEVQYQLSANMLVTSMSGRCSCPVARNCKHSVALLITALRELRATVHPDPTPGGSTWERDIDSLFEDEAEPWPLALMLDFEEPPSKKPRKRSRWARVAAAGGLKAAPMRPGKRSAWVASNVSWSKIRAGNFSGMNSLHARTLKDLLTVCENDLMPATTSGWMPLSNADSPLLWLVLERLRVVGVEILDSEAGRPVVLESTPGNASISITASETGDLKVAAAITHPRLVPGQSMVWLGSPPHAIVWKEDQTLHLAALDPPVSAEWRNLGYHSGGITVPSGDREAFERGQFRRIANLGWQSPDGSFEPEPLPPPVLRLLVKLTPTGQPGQVPRAILRWSWRYGDGPDVPLAPAPFDLTRDVQAEQAILDSLPLEIRQEQELVGMDVVDLVEQILPQLKELGVVVSSEELPIFRPAQAPRVDVNVFESPPTKAEPGTTDWLDLELTMEVEGQQVPMAALVTALTQQEDSLFLPGGIYVSLSDPGLDRLRDLLEEARQLGDRRRAGLRVPKVRSTWWKELLDLDVVSVADDSWLAKLAAALQTPPEPAPRPKGLQAELRPYQETGFQWLAGLRRSGLGGVLADDMGLGKTVQTLAMIADERETSDQDGLWLVVAPTSVVGNWVSEARRFTPGLRVQSVEATVKKRGSTLSKVAQGVDVLVTSYTLLRMEATDYAALPVVGMVLDEAQQAKNPASMTFSSLVSVRAPATYAITGTPMENNLGELWSMFALTAPGLLGSGRVFSDAYRKPIEREGSSDLGKALMSQLQRRIAPFLLRRTKGAVAQELPPKQEQIFAVDLAPAHRRLYDRQLQRERQRALHLAEDFDHNRVEVLSALTRLRQMAIDASLVMEDSKVPSSKLDALLPLLHEAADEGHRVLVFSQFTRYLKLIADHLTKDEIAFSYLDGATTNRRRVIVEFEEGDAPVFLISLKAGGVGLNLTMADYVVLTDPWWNPAVEAQAVDRTHRIGQERPVHVYRLVARDTIEEKVLALQEGKRQLFDAVVGDGEPDASAPRSIGAALTAEDLQELLA